MPNNVQILSGTVDWQIFQQIDGAADIRLQGNYALEDMAVWARVVSETDQRTVVPWQRADAADGRFTLCLPGVPAGGLYRIETVQSNQLAGIEWGPRGDSVFHIGVGDLYVIAGQSNATGYGRTPAEDAPDMRVHLYKNEEVWDMAAHPLGDSTRSRHEVNAEGANPGHSPWLAFAKAVAAERNRPVGLIQTSRGGSSLAEWSPAVADGLYRNMIDVVNRCTGGANRLAGVLWYQGCSDCGEETALSYGERFASMVAELRRAWNSPDLPLYTVQLNKQSEDGNEPFRAPWWRVVRQQQRLAARTLPGVFLAPTLDLALNDCVHNASSSNLVIGRRVAEQALGRGLAPDLDRARLLAPDEVELTFSHVTQALHYYGLVPAALQIEVEDRAGVVPLASYTGEAARLVLHLTRPAEEGCTVSFVPGREAHPCIPYDVGTGLPLLAFDREPVIVCNEC